MTIVALLTRRFRAWLARPCPGCGKTGFHVACARIEIHR